MSTWPSMRFWSQFYMQSTPLPRKRLPDVAATDCGGRHLVAAYYSFIDPERTKGWVGLVGWLIADGLPIWSPASCRSNENRESLPIKDQCSTAAACSQLMTMTVTKITMLRVRWQQLQLQWNSQVNRLDEGMLEQRTSPKQSYDNKMAPFLSGNPSSTGWRFGLVVTRWPRSM